MNKILNRNIDALASIATLFVFCFGYENDNEIIDASALFAKEAALEWYRKNGIKFDLATEPLCAPALRYAGMELLRTKEEAEAEALKVIAMFNL